MQRQPYRLLQAVIWSLLQHAYHSTGVSSRRARPNDEIPLENSGVPRSFQRLVTTWKGKKQFLVLERGKATEFRQKYSLCADSPLGWFGMRFLWGKRGCCLRENTGRLLFAGSWRDRSLVPIAAAWCLRHTICTWNRPRRFRVGISHTPSIPCTIQNLDHTVVVVLLRIEKRGTLPRRRFCRPGSRYKQSPPLHHLSYFRTFRENT